MIEELIKEWMKRLPDWVFTATSIIFIFLICMIALTIHKTVKRYSEAIGREDKVSNLHEELVILKEESRIHKENSKQMLSVIINTKLFLKTIYSRIDITEKNHFRLLQRIIDALASDIKSSGLERHRCGFWVFDNDDPDDDFLKLIIGSSGFPEDYINERRLSINNSIAGRSFRKKQNLNIPDVNQDSDWDKPDKSNKYKALICIPIEDIGVLTIDAQDEMDDNLFQISLLYAALLEVGFYQMFSSDEEDNTSQEETVTPEQEAAATE